MSGETKEQRLQKVHERALERFDKCYASQRDMRLLCVQDRRFVFVNGAQFEGEFGENFENRPRFEINKVHQSVIRIFSEYRNNRVTVDFRPEDEDTSEETAEFLDGLYRADEQESGAQEAYDTAFEEGVAGGMGAWRLANRYEDEDDDEADEDDDRRRICIEPIPDADNSVFFDIGAKRYDKKDATYGFVITGHQADAYEDMTGEDPATLTKDWQAKRKGKSITSFDRVSRMGIYDWFAPSITYVAEYFEVEEIKEPVNFYRSASGEEVKLRGKAKITADEPKLLAQGFTLARVKRVGVRKVHRYIIDGARVLEDKGHIAGKHIPVVPFYAKRLFVDNIERIMGQVRLATDLQRLYNMLCSLLAEIAVHSPIEKPIVTPEQIAGHEQTWAEDSVKRYPYALLNPITDPASGQTMGIPPMQYTKPPQVPPALAGLLQLIGMDLQEVLGASANQQEVVSNISAKAVELIQNRLDMQNFIYMDNFKKSMKRCGEIWLSMAKDLYDEDDRPMRTVNLDGSDEVQKLRVPTKGEDEKVTYLNDPGGGKFKVVADVGPSFTTRRDGTVRSITGMLQFVEDPQDKAVLTGVAIQNLEGEGLQDVKAYWRNKMIVLGVTKPTDEEAQEMEAAKANQQPDPQAQFLMAEAKKSLALAEKANADSIAALAKAKESEASAAEKLAKIEALPLEQLLALVDRLDQPMAQPTAQPVLEQPLALPV